MRFRPRDCLSCLVLVALALLLVAVAADLDWGRKAPRPPYKQNFNPGAGR